MSTPEIPFNKPFATGRELEYIRQAHELGHLSADGSFTARCQSWLEQAIGAQKALLTHSCTGALDAAALLASLGPGDEVIVPSFTFVSTASCIALRGATPVFVDIRADTLNLDERLVEAAITPRTRAIIPVHYAGVACEMDTLTRIARRHGLLLIEDAAQALGSSYKGRPLGSIGDFSALSFHETKNIISGEGGALLLNAPGWIDRAEMIRHKGTNRRRFLRGEVDRYTWEELGSSFGMAELSAAFLWAQMEHASEISARRAALWKHYHEAFEPIEVAGLARRPRIPEDCTHNAHLYYLLVARERRDRFIERMKARGIYCVFHYVPLHDSPAGRKHGRIHDRLPVTESAAAELVRLPLWVGLEPHQGRVIEEALSVLETSD